MRGKDLHERMRSLLEGGGFPAHGGELAAKAAAERFVKDLLMEDLKKRGWTMLVEAEFGLTRDLRPTGFESLDSWVRGRLDLVMVPPEDSPKEPLVVVDWKTGRTPGSRLQLQVAAALLYPDHKKRKMTGLFGYLDQGRMARHAVSMPAGVEATRAAMAEVEASWKGNDWPRRRGGPACRWCALSSGGC
jgi:CRISPR/Cas system-associated exonuclease Cas4 (RecB family)